MAKITKQTELSRFQAFLFLLFFLTISLVSIWGGYSGLVELYSYNQTISYHKITFILPLMSVMFFLCAVAFIHILVTGKTAPKHVQIASGYCILILFFISVIVFPISNFYATSLLEKRGYILCPRVLGESVVGGGRTWALSKELCLQNRLERESSTRNRLQQTE